MEKVEIHPMPVVSAESRVVFSRKTVAPDIVERFNRSLAELKTQAGYNDILNKYGVIDYSVK